MEEIKMTTYDYVCTIESMFKKLSSKQEMEILSKVLFRIRDEKIKTGDHDDLGYLLLWQAVRSLDILEMFFANQESLLLEQKTPEA